MRPEYVQAKKGLAEMLILSVLDGRDRHGYEIARLIEQRSAGVLEYHTASLYPVLYRLEARGWIRGKWVEKPNERRRRFYALTALGRQILKEQRASWSELATAITRVTRFRNA